ncbi:MAG: hypothetical protein NC126_03195 [Clostridium sp.]|nr:hypothetical protein [Clostridium sp.]
MALDKSFDNVLVPKEEGKKEITRLTVLDKQDKSTIYNVIFVEGEMKDNG